MLPDVSKHLEFVQNAIERMARNSFSVKGCVQLTPWGDSLTAEG